MGINKFRIWHIAQLFPLFILSSFSCNEEDETVFLYKEFSLPVEISPSHESYKVGDTLLVEIQFSKVLFDRKNTIEYLFENYDFDSYMGIRELKEKHNNLLDQPGANSKFKILTSEGEINTISQGGNKLILNFTGSEYKLSSRIILLEPGIFTFIFSPGINLNNAELFNSQTGSQNFIAGVGPTYYTVNKGQKINMNLITEYTSSTFDLPDSIDWSKPTFSFKVME